MELERKVIRILRELIEALEEHHLGRDTLKPFGVTYKRDRDLLRRAKEILMDLEFSRSD